MLGPGPALSRGRAAAEALMADTCTIQRATGETTDTETGEVVTTYDPVYTGKCKIQQQSASASPSDVGQAGITIGQLELHVPTSATGLAPDDLVTVTASAHDPDLAGRVFRIRGMSHKTWLTARRLTVIEVTS